MNQKASNRIYARQHINRLLPFDKRLYGAYKNVFLSLTNRFVAGVKAGDGISSIPSKKTIRNAIVSRVLPAYRGIIRTGMLNALKEVEQISRKPLVKIMKAVSEEDLEDFGFGEVLNEIEDESMTQIVLVSANYFNRMKKVFEMNEIAGQSVYDLARKLMEVSTYDAEWMALRTARTETNRAYSAATQAGYEKSSIVSGKEWVAYPGQQNPRESHLDADGQIVDVDEPFIVDGEELMYPCDPDGSPENTINCHCSFKPVIGRS